MQEAAKYYSVIFVEEPVFEKDCKPQLTVEDREENITIVTPVLPQGLSSNQTMVMQRVLLSMLLKDRKSSRRFAWYCTPLAFPMSNLLYFDLVVYDCTSALSSFKEAPANLRSLETQLLERASAVFTDVYGLYEAKKDGHANIHPFPNGVDIVHFGKCRRTAVVGEPTDQASIGKPRIGFFGAVDDRIDQLLLRELAERRPEYHFVMLGEILNIAPNGLAQLPNIHWLSQKNYNELPDYMAHWNAGFLPFAMNESTKFRRPAIAEFLAAGLPVVSTPISDVVRFWGDARIAEIANRAENFGKKLDMVLSHSYREAWISRADEKLHTTTWAGTFAGMRQILLKAVNSKMHGKHQHRPWRHTSLSNVRYV